MNLKSGLLCLGLGVSSALALAANPAQAFDFTSGDALGSCATIPGQYSGGPFPTSCTTEDGFTLTAAGGGLSQKTVIDTTGVGVSGGFDGGEIDGQESITLSLGQARKITSLDLGFLYQPGEFYDLVYEIAGITVNDGSPVTGQLKVTGTSTATWSFPGAGNSVVNKSVSLDNLQPGETGGGGRYSILNPFGDLKVSSFTLKAIQNTYTNWDGRPYAPIGAANSDFSLVGATAAAVPEPATLAGIGLLGGSLALVRRRKTANG